MDLSVGNWIERQKRHSQWKRSSHAHAHSLFFFLFSISYFFLSACKKQTTTLAHGPLFVLLKKMTRKQGRRCRGIIIIFCDANKKRGRHTHTTYTRKRHYRKIEFYHIPYVTKERESAHSLTYSSCFMPLFDFPQINASFQCIK